MDIEDDDVSRVLADRSRAAADMLEQSLMQALGNVEAELVRVVRTGEADLERLAVLFLETVAKLANSAGSGSASDGGPPASANQVASAIARAVLRGSRFS